MLPNTRTHTQVLGLCTQEGFPPPRGSPPPTQRLASRTACKGTRQRRPGSRPENPSRRPEAGPRPPRVPAQRSQRPSPGQPLWQQTLEDPGRARTTETSVLGWSSRGRVDTLGIKTTAHSGSNPQGPGIRPQATPCRGSTRKYPVDTVRPQ